MNMLLSTSKMLATTVAIGGAVALLCGQAFAFDLTLDYTYDTFFTGSSADSGVARSALEAAASDVSMAITTVLTNVSTDVYTGTYVGPSGPSTATADWSLTYTNPATGLTGTSSTFSLAANEIRIYVGMRPLSGSTLGQGGPSGAGVSVGTSTYPGELDEALRAMEDASNPAMVRGGPILGTMGGSISSEPFSVSYGYLLGSMAFDNDSNNDSLLDDDATLSTYWHFDHTTPVEAGKSDLYSVAVHELLHAAGFATGESWDALASGSNWSGSAVTMLLGSGTGALMADSNHIAEGLAGTPWANGVFLSGTQEAAMDPTLTTGTRKYLTDLDFAFLQDMGWAVPEPATIGLLGIGLGAALVAKRRRLRCSLNVVH